jgi:hypothetical protein
MEYILNNTILALLDSPGNTMMGIARMYIDKKYRKRIVDNIKDPMVKAFWVDEFAQYSEKYRTEAIAPIQNKVGQFLSSGIIRNIVGQPRSTIDLRSIMDNQKILLMDLSKGKVGEDNSALLGAMVITKLQLAALSRVDIPENDRKDFFLYVDEFQNFVTESFATILSEARKYRLNLTIGHQYIGQLAPDRNNTRVRDAVFGNVGTMVCFRVGAADAEFLETEFDPTFTPNDIVNLPKYNIILRLMINGVASDPFSAVTMPVREDWATGNSEKVIKVSRERYANPVIEVEEKIMRWMGAETHQEIGLIVGRDEDESPAEQIAEAVQEKTAESVKKALAEVTGEPLPDPAEQSLNATTETPPAIPEPPAEIEQIPKPEVEQEPEVVVEAPRPEAKPHNQQPQKQESQNKNGNQNRGQRFAQPRRKNKSNKNKQKARDVNPIWKTVESLNDERATAELQKVQRTGEVAPMPETSPPDKNSETGAQVIRPGIVHKF